MKLEDILSEISKDYNINKNELFKKYIKKKTKTIKSNVDLNIFTDGSWKKQKHILNSIGIGIYMAETKLEIGKKIDLDEIGSNNKAELTAILYAVNNIPKKYLDKKIMIYSDSEYSIKSLTLWSKNWIKNGWKTKGGKDVKNSDLIKEILEQLKKYNISFKHVNSHQSSPSEDSDEYFYWNGNDIVDKLAQNALN
jgi:ribonuclease HI